MAPMRCAHTSIRVHLYGLLCCAVLMQMLGTPATLRSLDFDSDLTDSSMFEELSLPPDNLTLTPIERSQPHFQLLFHHQVIPFEHILFRPPYQHDSPSAT